MKHFFEYLDNANPILIGFLFACLASALFFAIDWILGDSKSNFDKYFNNKNHE